ncbi:MAG: hypothetical protein IPO04_17970 [Cytophagaceae bacterium]|nr:hypothetical protein [Cytophagaceae bacterium]
MSKRFSIMFFTMVFLANCFFFQQIEPEKLNSLYDKLLSLFLFQFDYFLLFVYITLKSFSYPFRALFFLSFVYGSLFVMGMSSILVNDMQMYDIIYSYIQPILRLIFMGIFINIGIKSKNEILRKDKVFLAIGLAFGLYFFILLNFYPRPSMWSFNFYWIALMSFFVVGILVKKNTSRLNFSIGLLFVLFSDLYYILPPEARLYELTYIFIRIINTLGEFFIVNFVLIHYLRAKE